MKKIYIFLIIICCLFLYIIIGKNIVYAENSIDCESISNGIAKNVEKYHIIIGSMSKSFTAISIMQLVEENMIDIDKPISTYIDTSLYFKNKEDGDKITVKQLLNQNSGLGTYQKLGKTKITNNYGKYEYANINYNLLGKIVESVSNETYADYVNKNIFIPLKMDNSSATLEESEANGLIKGYRNYFGIPIAGKPVLMHSGFVENYTSNMFIIPESDIGIVVLVNMNDYLVTNNLLGNIVMPLWEKKHKKYQVIPI